MLRMRKNFLRSAAFHYKTFPHNIDPICDLLEFYMGKNSAERQGFIIGNLRIEADYVEDLI